MNIALNEAKKAYTHGEVPVGAVIVKDGKIISKAYNQKEKYLLVTKHAEIIAIEKASRKLKNWRLEGCDIYVSLEPCPMCASAIKQARISNVYCGLANSYENNRNIIEAIFEIDRTNTNVNFIPKHIDESRKLLNSFFKDKRD